MSESIREVLAREADEAESRADAEERGEIAPAPGQRGHVRAKDPSQVYAVRIPVSKLRRLRELAEERGTPPTVLIRQWVLERLDDADARELRGDTAENREDVGTDGLKLGPRRKRAISLSGANDREQVRRHA